MMWRGVWLPIRLFNGKLTIPVVPVPSRATLHPSLRPSSSSSSSSSPHQPRGHAKRDLYAIMGVSPHATQRQIKNAYYNLSMKYHPDRNRDSPDAHRHFTELTEAYSVLGQYELRKKYDKGLLSEYPRQTSHPQAERERKRTDVRGERVKFDFDEFYRAHYGEALKRERQKKREREAWHSRRREKTLSDTSQRLLIVGVTLSVFLVAWVGVGGRRRKHRTRLFEPDDSTG